MLRLRVLFVLSCLLPLPAVASDLPRAGASSGDLSGAAQSASEAIRRHQQPPGYWLTRFTSLARFEDSKPEMNTYLTAVMIDLLDPVAARAQLAENVAKARSHLRSQIEETGLVRYNGRPGSAEIRAALGAVMAPDSDETSLTWRIAPGNDPKLFQGAMDVLKRYRTSEGLYQTWLTPGPNSVDSGIQMHVYLLLAKADPVAARQLCLSLQKAIAFERIWFYNSQAPLEGVLRQQQMADAGCPLEIPEEHRTTSVPGQRIWLDAARLFGRLTSAEGPRPAASEVKHVLAALSRADFALLRGHPPLLYHTEAAARAPRFYWSEDFGYALWLRLYFENARRSGIKG